MFLHITKSKLLIRFIDGVKWSFLASVISQGSVFASSIIVARLLGTKLFGEIGIIQSTVGMLSAVAGVGLGSTATKYVSQFRISDPKKTGKIIGLCSTIAWVTSLLFSVGLLFFAPLLATHSLNNPDITNQLRIASIYVLFFTINGYQLGALIGFECFSSIAKIGVFQGVTSLIITYIFTSSFGLTGASIALGISAFVSWILYLVKLRNACNYYRIKIQYNRLWSESSIFTTFAIPSAISGIIGGIAIWETNALLVQQTDGFLQMAIYNAANNFRIIILFVPGLISRVASPILSNLIGQKNNADYQNMFWMNLCVTAGISLIVAILISIGAPFLLNIYGRDFVGGRTLVMLLSFSTFIEVIATALFQTLFVHGKIWWQALISFIWSMILVGFTIVTIKTMGAMGLGFAFLLAHMFSAASYYSASLLINKKEKIKCS